MQSNHVIDHECLLVFARISAAVSHEVKNTLSIINENAGLLEDLSLMTGEGEGLPKDRVVDTAKNIMKQVDRSNGIMKNLNRFAHSCDSPVGEGMLDEILLLMMELTSRQASMKKILFSVKCSVGIKVQIDLLVFESLLFTLLMHFYDLAEEKSVIEIEAKTVDEKIEVVFTFEGDEKKLSEHFPYQIAEPLAAQAGVDLKVLDGAILLGISHR